MNQRDPHLPFPANPTASGNDVPDVQGRADARHIAIDQVGIRGIRHPLRVKSADGSVQHTVGTFSMTVKLTTSWTMTKRKVKTQQVIYAMLFVRSLPDNDMQCTV